MWSETWSEVGWKCVETVPVTAVSLLPCAINQGRSIDFHCDPTASATIMFHYWYTSDVGGSSDEWSEDPQGVESSET